MDKCCGNCKHFKNEDASGKGWCEHYERSFRCEEVACKAHCLPNNGWTEITHDNVEEIKSIEKRVVIANIHHDSTFYRCLHDVNGLVSMAKNGGYYYYVLPELKIE